MSMGLETAEGDGGSSSLPKEWPSRMSGETEAIGEGALEGEGFYWRLTVGVGKDWLCVAGQGGDWGG